MGVWRPKQEESKSIWFRVPASLKREFEELRQRAEAEGMDAAATFTAALGRLAKQLRDELPESKQAASEAARQPKVKGLESGSGSRANGASETS
jgi:hypothetical protein